MVIDHLRLRANTAQRALASVSIGAAAVALFASLAAPALATFAALGVFATASAWLLRASRARGAGELELVARGIELRAPGLRAVIAREEIEDGWTEGGKLVLRTRDGGGFECATVDRSPADVLAHLGLTLDQRALEAPLRGMIGPFVRGLLVFLALACALGGAATRLGGLAVLLSVALALASAIGIARWLRPRVVVGADGVRVTGVLRPEFIPYAEITRAAAASSPGEIGVALETARGPRLLPTVGQTHGQIAALLARIEEGRARFARSAARPLEILDRRARTVAEWTKAVESAAAPGFRDLALGRGDLEEILLDPRAPLERRVGAALGLRKDPEGARKIRVAAETAAEPRARVALEQAAREELDEEALLKALE